MKDLVFPAISVEMMCCGGQYNPTARHTRKVVRNIEFKNRLEREKGLASYNNNDNYSWPALCMHKNRIVLYRDILE